MAASSFAVSAMNALMPSASFVVVAMSPLTARRKAKRLQDVRGVAAAAASDAGPKTKALLADRDDLERALRAWLRSDDDAAAEDPAAR